MMQRSIAQSTSILRSASRSATVLRHLSAASAPSIVKNSHYNVEEFHRREVLEAIRTVSGNPLLEFTLPSPLGLIMHLFLLLP